MKNVDAWERFTLDITECLKVLEGIGFTKDEARDFLLERNESERDKIVKGMRERVEGVKR